MRRFSRCIWRPACLEHLAHHVHLAHPVHHRCAQRSGAADPRARVHSAPRSRAFCWITSTRRPPTMAARDGCGCEPAWWPARPSLFALHYFAPSSGETMVRRFFLWQVLNLFERPGDRQFMIPLVVMVIAWIVAPARARLVSVIALSLSAMILAYSIAQRHQQRAAVARAGAGDPGRGLALSAGHVLAHRPDHAADAAAGGRRLSSRASRGWAATGRAANARCTCCGSAGCCGSA